MRWKIWPSSKQSKQELEKEGISLLERAIKSLPAILVGILLTFFLSRSGLFRQLETYALDTQVRLQGAAPDSDVAIVLIDDEDYAQLFHRKSPLDHAVLLKLINAIAAGKPKVIGIDIDTSAPEFQELHLPLERPVLVWARGGMFSQVDDEYHLSEYLGGQQTNGPSGLVVLRLDADGAIRRYPRICETNLGPQPSFPWAVAREFDPAVAGRPQSPTDLFIKFAGDRHGSHRVHFTASRILSLADGPGWQTTSPIKDKVVLLGGAYAAEDEHDTPLGWMLGVEVLAYATETELGGGGLRPPSSILVTALGGLVGVALLLVFQHFKPTKAWLISLAVMPLMGMLSSMLIFRTLAFWSYFLPIPLAVLAQEVYGQAKDYRKKMIKQLYEGVLGRPIEAEPEPPPPLSVEPEAPPPRPAEAKATVEVPIKIDKPLGKIE